MLWYLHFVLFCLHFAFCLITRKYLIISLSPFCQILTDKIFINFSPTRTHTHTENGLLSYENPNYHLDPKSIKHNQNLFEEIMSESKQRASNGETKAIMSNRKGYACLDIGSMGVDLKENFE
jgi:hypothetical protein